MDKTEVTVGAYAKCVQAGACTVPGDEPSGHGATDETIKKLGPLCNANKPDRQQHPINCVDWDQANAYCTWAKGRLPSKAEWLAAAGTRTYPWGDEPLGAKRLNACGPECEAMFERTIGKKFTPLYAESDGFEATAPVGSYPAGATASGILDLAGNVGEWNAEWHEAGKTRLFLGGSWDMGKPEDFASNHKGADAPGVKSVLIGFRCVYGS
jgi:formylglycine-generating enzyme required for sulfatase activity